MKTLLFVSLAMIWLVNSAWAKPPMSSLETVRVVRVVDGDTVRVRMSNDLVVVVRLAQIDAPEIGQPWGIEAKMALIDFVGQKEVQLEVTGKDRYGRYIASILLKDVNVNMALVESGHAWAYRRYLEDKSIVDLEVLARRSQKGLWSDKGAVPPWEWRRGKRHSIIDVESEPVPVFCGRKRTCSQMNDCKEAQMYLKECGLLRLDGDKDGIPCEAICGK